jgi:hypothetical protein
VHRYTFWMENAEEPRDADGGLKKHRIDASSALYGRPRSRNTLVGSEPLVGTDDCSREPVPDDEARGSSLDVGELLIFC